MGNNSAVLDRLINSKEPSIQYNTIFALKTMGDAGFLSDSRCTPALDLLESKMLKNRGFYVETKYYRKGKSVTSRRTLVNCGVNRKNIMNEFVTVEVLNVLKQAGRINFSR